MKGQLTQPLGKRASKDARAFKRGDSCGIAPPERFTSRLSNCPRKWEEERNCFNKCMRLLGVDCGPRRAERCAKRGSFHRPSRPISAQKGKVFTLFVARVGWAFRGEARVE